MKRKNGEKKINAIAEIKTSRKRITSKTLFPKKTFFRLLNGAGCIIPVLSTEHVAIFSSFGAVGNKGLF